MRSRKKIGVIDLEETINNLLNEYGDEVYVALNESMKSVADMAVQELRAVSKFSPSGNPTGEYSKDWDKKSEAITRLSNKIIVYNEDHYRLTHLLEKGHALRRGGRKIGSVKAYPHIEPVEQKVISEFEKDVIDRITNI